MKPFHILFIPLVAIAGVFYACSSSTSSNPTSSTTGNLSFTFSVGSTFQFVQWRTDSVGIIDSTKEIVHETVADSMLTFQGMGVTYTVFDTTFDSTGTVFQSSDTLYYSVSGGTVYQYGFITQVFTILLDASLAPPPKWDKIADRGNTAGWLVDTTAFTPNGLLPLKMQLNGSDAGNVNATVGANSLQTDHVAGTGTLQLTAQGTTVSHPLSGNDYLSYNPAILAKGIIAPVPQALFGATIMGFERDLVSFTVK